MSRVLQKREVSSLDGTPDKRMYWSIISDYDLKSGICELVDNAIDLWMSRSPRHSMTVEINLDPERQLIRLKDNAGGVRKEQLRLLVAPGASQNSPDARTIGIFGVGSKRAVIALAESVAIKTRYSDQGSYQIDIDRAWLASPEWEIPAFEIPEIDTGVTEIELSALRKPLDVADIENLIEHLSETYWWFLTSASCKIVVNGKSIKGKSFEAWAFPPKHLPRRCEFSVDLGNGENVEVTITTGLIRDRDPVRSNYGVYFYCNHRLIAKEVKEREVGYFVASEAGVPHPDASLCRAIVEIDGAAKLMPWNSNKSGINFGHTAFQGARPTLIQLVSHFSSLSRRLKNDWDKKVFKYARGKIKEINAIDGVSLKKLILPPLPKVNKRYGDTLKELNKKQIRDNPWTMGLVETMAVVDTINRQKLETKNRVALILLDSNFEIALKEFIVHRTDKFPARTTNIQHLFERRHRVIDAIKPHVAIDTKTWEKASHYYGLRNKLVHERATVDITSSDVENYQSTVEEILSVLFDLEF